MFLSVQEVENGTKFVQIPCLLGKLSQKSRTAYYFCTDCSSRNKVMKCTEVKQLSNRKVHIANRGWVLVVRPIHLGAGTKWDDARGQTAGAGEMRAVNLSVLAK